MSGAAPIRYLTRKEIDAGKWDDCIAKADNGRIYAYSFYLDRMARHWDALVMGDYETVMPLPWNSKFGIRYIYQPFLTAQLGVFGRDPRRETTGRFIDAIPSSFRLTEISLNPGNISGIPSRYTYPRSNYVLDLSPPYETLFKNYRENIRRNIRKAEQLGYRPQREVEVEQVIRLAVSQMRSYSRESAENVHRFRELYRYLHEKKQALTYGIISPQDELLASCVFFLSHHRAYYILVGNHPNGRTTGASHALVDAFIKDHAGKKMLLDFEGSDIRNLAFFYSSFGARQEIYPALKINRLPFYLKWMKR